MIPKIQETKASAARPRTTNAKRSLRSRGLVRFSAVVGPGRLRGAAGGACRRRSRGRRRRRPSPFAGSCSGPESMRSGFGALRLAVVRPIRLTRRGSPPSAGGRSTGARPPTRSASDRIGRAEAIPFRAGRVSLALAP